MLMLRKVIEVLSGIRIKIYHVEISHICLYHDYLSHAVQKIIFPFSVSLHFPLDILIYFRLSLWSLLFELLAFSFVFPFPLEITSHTILNGIELTWPHFACLFRRLKGVKRDERTGGL
jgi:hypothetical protein